MKISDEGLAFIYQYYPLELEAVPDETTGGTPWRIGYGHTGAVKKGDRITQKNAESHLRQDIVKFEFFVNNALAIETSQHQFDALVSLAYCIGIGNFVESTLIRKHNASCFQCAAAQFAAWRNAPGGRELRMKEREVYYYGYPTEQPE